MNGRVFSALALVAVLAAPLAHAQERNVALAEEAFGQAKALMEQNKFAEACPKFAESYRQDPQLGTQINLALCYEKAGKTVSAWGEYKDLEVRARQLGQTERAEYAKGRVAELSAKLSRVKFVVASPAERQTLKVDGTEVGAALWADGVPQDPGKHTVEVGAPNKKTWKGEITVAPGPANQTVNVPALEDGPPEQVNTVIIREGRDTKTLGFVVGGVGAAALVAGGVLGIVYLGKRSEANDACPGNTGPCPDEETFKDYTDKDKSAKAIGWISTGAVALGVVGLGLGTYFVLTSSKSSREKPARGATWRLSPTAGLRTGGLNLSGTF